MAISEYMKQRLAQKNGTAKTSQQERAEKKPVPIARKSAKKIESEKQAKKSTDKTLSKFFAEMIEAVPEKCMETGERLIYKITPVEVIVHILAKRSITNGGVPSQAKNPLNIVYFNIEIHTLYDKDMGPKSKGKYVTAMKSYSLLKERVSLMWASITKEERKNIPQFLKPE